MRIRILGSAAGGGVPQWNCRCPNCAAARAGSGHVKPRTQSSVAVSADGRAWYLLNVSPDVRRQILDFPPLGPPDGAVRGQGIAGCVLADAELDHTAGLLQLREGGTFGIFSTARVRGWLNRYFPVEPILSRFAKPSWTELPLDGEAVSLSEELSLRAFALDPHVPRFVDEDATPGSVSGLAIEDWKTGRKLVYAPCVGSLSEPLVAAAKNADAILLDGTFWSDDEPIHAGIRSSRTARAMGHLPVGGGDGSLVWLADQQAKHRYYVHINNTNPMLNERGAEYAQVSSRGVRVAADGDMFDL
jgi:pyrroloquinoline quinone biosynthesis protein B